MSSSYHKKIREISKMVGTFADDHDIDVTNGNHLRVVIRNGVMTRTLIAAKTPSDHRAILNFRSQVKRAVLDIKAEAGQRAQ